MNTKQYSNKTLELIERKKIEIANIKEQLKSPLLSKNVKKQKEQELTNLKDELDTLKANKLPRAQNRVVKKGFAA